MLLSSKTFQDHCGIIWYGLSDHPDLMVCCLFSAQFTRLSNHFIYIYISFYIHMYIYIYVYIYICVCVFVSCYHAQSMRELLQTSSKLFTRRLPICAAFGALPSHFVFCSAHHSTCASPPREAFPLRTSKSRVTSCHAKMSKIVKDFRSFLMV